MKTIIDSASGEIIKGRVRWVGVLDDSPSDLINDAQAEDAKYSGSTRATLVDGLIEERKSALVRTPSGRRAYTAVTYYVRDNSADVEGGAWWAVELEDES